MGWEIALMLVYVGIAFLLIYITTKLDEENSPLKLLFLVIGLYVLLLGITSARTILTVDGITSDGLLSTIDTTYKVLLWVIRLVIAYFIIYFLYKTALAIMTKKKLKQEDEYEY